MQPVTQIRTNMMDEGRIENESLNYRTVIYYKITDGARTLQFNIINQSHVQILQFRIAPK